jgi:hypothetical protein
MHEGNYNNKTRLYVDPGLIVSSVLMVWLK